MSPLPRFTFGARLALAAALGLPLACTACGGGRPAVPADLIGATANFSGGIDRSRAPRFRPLQDSITLRLARACVAGATMGELERMGITDVRSRLDTLVAARVVRLDGRRCAAGFPVFLGARRAELTREADTAAARLAPFVESLAVRVDSATGGRTDVTFHLLWSRVMDVAWDAAWRRAFPRDSLPVVRWLAVPERRFAVGTNYEQTVGDGGLAVTWATPFTEHLAPLADRGLELTQLAWRRPVTDDSARAALVRFGILDSLGTSHLFAYPAGGPLDSALDALARAYGERAATAADWTEAGRRLGTDPRDLFVILLHEIAYGVFERLSAAGRLEVPRALLAGTPRTDAAGLVSLALGRPPRPGDEAITAYVRNGWRGSEAVVGKLRQAVSTSPGDVELRWTLGVSLYDVGRYDEAAAAFRWVTTAARRDPAHARLVDWSRLWVGHCYDAQGRRADALSVYREVARTGDSTEQMMMGQYGIGPVTARAWARLRLESPFHPPR